MSQEAKPSAAPGPAAGSLDSMRVEHAALRERKRWSEADLIGAGAIDLALSQHEVRGPALGDFVYVAGGPRPDMTPCHNADKHQLPDERRLAMRAIQGANRGTDRTVVIELAERVLASDGWREAGCFWHAVLALAYAGQVEAARATCRRAVNTPDWASTPRHRDALTLLRARLATLAGEPLVARQLLTEALAHGVYPQFTGLAVAWAVVALVQLGKPEQAKDLLHDHSFDASLDGVADRAELLSARGAMYLREGRPHLSYQDFLACGRELGQWAVTNPAVCTWRSQGALAARAIQRPNLASALAQEELLLARSWGTPRAIGIALHAAALVGDEEVRADLLAEAADSLECDGASNELDQARHDLGVALSMRGQYRESRHVLEMMRRAAKYAGNTAWIRRAEEAIRRSDRLASAGGLTKQETRIAELARAEYSNEEIAERLHLAKRTVEFHLSAVYRKLGVSGRSDLMPY